MNLRALIPLLLCIAAPLASAQLEPIDAPITLSAAPAIAVPGATVVLSGATPFVTGKPGEVQLTITPPAADGGDGDGTPITVTAAVDKEGQYTLSFKDTAVMGEYRVLATAPDGKGSSNGKFGVLLMTGEQVAEQVTGTVYKGYQQVLSSSEQALDGVEEILVGLPDSSEKAQGIAKLAQLKTQLADRKKATAQASIQLGKFAEVVTTAGGAAALKAPLAQVLDSVGAMEAKAREHEAQVQRRIADSKGDVDICVRLDAAMELLNLTSMLINLYDAPVKIIINLFTDKAIPAGIDGAQSKTPGENLDNKKFVLAESQKGLAAFGLSGKDGLSFPSKAMGPGSVSFFTGIAIDITNFVLKKIYESRCTRFEGPFTGSIKSRFLHESKPFWKYEMQVRGKLVLSAPKGATETQMRGRFEGQVVSYEVEQHLVKALAPQLEQFLVFSKVQLPFLGANALLFDESGSYFNQAIPSTFYVPTTAVRRGDKIIVNTPDGGQVGLLPKANRGMFYAVIMSGLIPELVMQPLPFESAEFLISRGMRKDAEFVISGSKGEQVIQRQFTRHESLDNGNITVDFAVDVKACDPKCTKSTLQKGSEAVKGFTDHFKSPGQK